MNEIKERGILFTWPNVCGILEDRKGQTRRLQGLKALNDGYYRDRIGKVEFRGGKWCFWDFNCGSSALPVFTAKCPYGTVGDRLWARETFSSEADGRIVYAADRAARYRHLELNEWAGPQFFLSSDYKPAKWRPAIFMPRWASRITLEITEVRVQRLQDISEEDAWVEGCQRGDPTDNGGFFPAEEPDPSGIGHRGWDCAVDWYADLWESIHGPGSWEKNPWVFAISFKRIKP